jgi:flagellar export protein FliJ
VEPFRFRLEKVLSWQRTQTDLEENRTKQMSAALAQTRAALVEVESSRAGAGRETVQAATLHPRDLAALAGYRRRLALREAALRRQEQECEQRLADQRRRWVEARRRCRLLEKLKERRLAEYTLQLGREFDAQASEMFLSRWRR